MLWHSPLERHYEHLFRVVYIKPVRHGVFWFVFLEWLYDTLLYIVFRRR